jgi:hypothetical protein
VRQSSSAYETKLHTCPASDLDALREENQLHQTESSAQASQSAAILSLNMRLQSSAAKNQAKNIEFELRKLDAAQSKEWLGIVQPYLPQVRTSHNLFSSYENNNYDNNVGIC